MFRKKMIKRIILTPFQKFVQIESFSGILLMIATVAALIWANSPFGETYQALWDYKLGFTTEHFSLNKPLLLWINDGLMAIFFFLIGLEIKREFLIGELNSLKKISFPLFGAMGGMLVPVLFYFLLNKNPETAGGWGVPMATDIAFSLAILKLLGNRIPLSLKLFLTAFAIVDDLGAVLVIAIFYSSDINITFIGIALLLLAILYFLTWRGYYQKYILLLVGIVVWTLFLKAGIHPTLAGILLALAVPVRQKVFTPTFTTNLENILANIKKAKVSSKPILSKEQMVEIDELEHWTTSYQSPLQHLEHRLHNWVAYFIIPVFALANAGVVYNSDVNFDTALIRNIALCLVLGNSIGISTIVLLVKKLKIIEIPTDITNRHIVGVAFLAGVGFTMAIFIASLAFQGRAVFVDSAKIGILLGSFVSAIIGYLILWWRPK